MRLIDADELINILEWNKGQEKDALVSINNLVELISERPTAYDVDKLIESLEDKAMEHAINGQQFQEDGWDNHAHEEILQQETYEKAIEFVKVGLKLSGND